MDYTISRDKNWFLWFRNTLRPLPITATLLIATLVALAAFSSRTPQDAPYVFVITIVILVIARAVVTRWPWKKPIIVRFNEHGISYTHYTGDHTFVAWHDVTGFLLEYPASLASEAAEHGWMKVSNARSWWTAVRANKTNTIGFAHVFRRDGEPIAIPALDVHFAGVQDVLSAGVRSHKEIVPVPIIERVHYRNTGFMLLAFIPLIIMGFVFNVFSNTVYQIIMATFILVAIFGATQLIKSLLPALRAEVVQEYSPQAKMMTGSDTFARSVVYGFQRYVDIAFYFGLGIVVIVTGFAGLYFMFFV